MNNLDSNQVKLFVKEYIKLEFGPVSGLGGCAVRLSEAVRDHGALLAPWRNGGTFPCPALHWCCWQGNPHCCGHQIPTATSGPACHALTTVFLIQGVLGLFFLKSPVFLWGQTQVVTTILCLPVRRAVRC